MEQLENPVQEKMHYLLADRYSGDRTDTMALCAKTVSAAQDEAIDLIYSWYGRDYDGYYHSVDIWQDLYEIPDHVWAQINDPENLSAAEWDLIDEYEIDICAGIIEVPAKYEEYAWPPVDED